ncbi:MAG: DNA cytosine methyltransferase [Bacillota bacterium]
MQQLIPIERQYAAFFVFSGEGGGALGAQQAPPAHYRGLMATCEVLGGIDVDPLACQDFEMWTGVPSTCLDLFDRDQYRDFWGSEPPADWSEVTLDQIRAAAQNRRPNIVVITAPCKGYSGLLGNDRAQTRKYQALNRLAERGVFLTLEAWKDDPPEFILFENVKGITTRGARFLRNIRKLLAYYGYRWHEEHYDCGELGGLAQHRRRFLGVARLESKVPAYVYNPPKQRVRSIGEVLEQMPLPIDPDNPPADLDAAGGPMHTMPRLQWKTWVRLALIPPGGDWRDLQKIRPGEYSIVPVPGHPRHYDIVRTAELQGASSPLDSDVSMPGFSEDRTHPMKFRIQQMDQPAATVTGQVDVQTGAPIVADYRQPYMTEGETHPNKYHVEDLTEPSGTITGSRLGSGMGAVADPRPLGHTPMGNGRGAYLVQDLNDPSATITGDPSHRKSGGASVVADPRLVGPQRDGAMRVGDASDPSGPVLGSAAVTSSNGMGAVADPRYTREPRSGVYAVQDVTCPSRTVVGGKDPNGNMLSVADPRQDARFNNVQRVTDMADPAGAVTAASGTSNAAPVVADPRPAKREFFGNMLRVGDYGDPSNTVTGATGPNQAANLVADPRLTCQPRGNTRGPLGVMDWSQASGTVTGSGDVHTGAVTVADPRPVPPAGPPAWDCRIPGDNERGVWYIRSPHRDKLGRRCVHRPMTTLELLALQSFPWRHPDGRAVVLAGRSDRSWRERIGNALPPLPAAAIIHQMMISLLAAESSDFLWDLQQTGVWVQEPVEEPVGLQ